MIVYIGNFWELSNPAAGLELIEELKDKYYFKSYSKKRNKILRLLDMLYGIIKNKTQAKLVLIDTFSTFAIWIAFFCALLCKILNIQYIPIIASSSIIDETCILCIFFFENRALVILMMVSFGLSTRIKHFLNEEKLLCKFFLSVIINFDLVFDNSSSQSIIDDFIQEIEFLSASKIEFILLKDMLFISPITS